jgi:hypothetical protein
MNETMSLVLATAILTIGGLGLYMLKSSDEIEYEIYNEEDFDNEVLDKNNDLNDEDYDDQDYEEPEYEPKVRSRNKTKRNKKSGGTKRKY